MCDKWQKLCSWKAIWTPAIGSSARHGVSGGSGSEDNPRIASFDSRLAGLALWLAVLLQAGRTAFHEPVPTAWKMFPHFNISHGYGIPLTL